MSTAAPSRLFPFFYHTTRFIKASFALLLLTTACSQPPQTEEQTPTKPNIVFIVCDDLNDAIGAMQGHPQAITPHIDRLASEGVLFTNAQVNVPICGPSRASFLTGLYPHTTGYFGYNFISDHWLNNPVLKESRTFLQHFQDNGYHVMGTGKIFHNNQEDWSQFDEFGVAPDWGPWPWDGTSDDEIEFDSLSPWRNSVVHPSMPGGFGIDDSFGSLHDVPNVPADADNDVPGYSGWRLFFKPFKYNSAADRDLMPDELNARWVQDKVKEQYEKPFLMCVGINRPHTPMFAPQEFFDLFPLDSVQTARAKKDDLSDVPLIIKENGGLGSGLYGFHKYDHVMDAGGESMLKKWTQAYLANVTFLDEQIGKIVEAIRNSAYGANTYIFFTSDHGYHMGEKEYLFKNSPWEEAARVPLIVVGPGIGSAVVPQPVSLVDLFPTFNALSRLGDQVNAHTNELPLDGHSLLPLLMPGRGEWEGPDVALTAVAGDQPLEMATPGPPALQNYSVRSERFRYIRYYNGAEELYDHQDDPYEWRNLADEPDYSDIKSQLKKQLFSLVPLSDN
jgi:arylsulfatase A-like enzyme